MHTANTSQALGRLPVAHDFEAMVNPTDFRHTRVAHSRRPGYHADPTQPKPY